MSRVAVLVVLLAGCAAKVDRFTVDRVVDRGLKVADVPKACALGSSLAHPLAALGSERHPPHQAMVIAELTAATCDESLAWEAELDGLRARRNLPGEHRTDEVRDAELREDRAHTGAADRFWRAFGHLEAEFGPVGEGCPRLGRREEIVYLVGLVAGTLALLHDRAGGGEVDVPLDTLNRVARGARCLDDADWWHVPSALEATAWATIPGSGPPEADPWANLDAAAAAGETSGVRVARALQVLVGGNAGRSDVVRAGIAAHAASLGAVPRATDWALLDEYARLVTRHQSDLLWTQAEGYRTPALGVLPGDPPEEAPPAPFGEVDPFGE